MPISGKPEIGARAPQDEAVCRRCIQQHNEDDMENETTADLGGQTDIVERSAAGEETDMIGYALGCLTVGVVWFFWPKLRAWASGEQAKLVLDVKGEEAKLKEKL